MAIAVRRCTATNKAGEPCSNPVVQDNGLCPAHDPEHVVSRRFGSGPDHTAGPGAPSKFDEWRSQVMAEWESWVRPYLAARDSDDPQLGMKAGEFVFDRLWGKATQPVEHSGGIAGLFGDDPLKPTNTPIPKGEAT